ncbi:MAG: hypothetical protein LBT55_07515 [Clostridiaceae bacterium]|jgi:CRISPR-associated protein Cst1|nr:hypothetical protein [Clostridiaceae bacterium]
MNEISVRLDTAIFNAGIVGFIKILQRGSIPYVIERDELRINAADFAEVDLANLFVAEAVDKFYKSTPLYSWTNKMNLLLNSADQAEAKAFNDDKKSANSLMNGKMPKYIERCLGNLASNGTIELFEKKLISKTKRSGEQCETEKVISVVQTKFQLINKATNIAQLKETIADILRDIEAPTAAQALRMQYIAFSRIGMIWGKESWFNFKKSTLANFQEFYQKTFVEPLRAMFTTKKGGKKSCCNCGIDYNNLDSLSFMNDMGVDAARKKSAFWEKRFDLAVCPLCRLIFTCAPLGFNMLGQDLVFVNKSGSIDELIRANVPINFEADDKNYRYKLITNLTLQELEVKRKHDVHNIEVLIRHNDTERYSLDILDKRILKVFGDCKTEFNYIKGTVAKVDGDYINVCEKAMDCLFARRSLYGLIFKLINAGSNPVAIRKLLNIQIKREEKSMSYKMVRANKIWEEGYALKRYFAQDNQNENKLRGAIIKLQNALRTENRDLFFDILIRLYSGISKAIPDGFLEVMSSDDAFKEIGTAFILGTLGSKEKANETGDSSPANDNQ